MNRNASPASPESAPIGPREYGFGPVRKSQNLFNGPSGSQSLQEQLIGPSFHPHTAMDAPDSLTLWRVMVNIWDMRQLITPLEPHNFAQPSVSRMLHER